MDNLMVSLPLEQLVPNGQVSWQDHLQALDQALLVKLAAMPTLNHAQREAVYGATAPTVALLARQAALSDTSLKSVDISVSAAFLAVLQERGPAHA